VGEAGRKDAGWETDAGWGSRIHFASLRTRPATPPWLGFGLPGSVGGRVDTRVCLSAHFECHLGRWLRLALVTPSRRLEHSIWSRSRLPLTSCGIFRWPGLVLAGRNFSPGDACGLAWTPMLKLRHTPPRRFQVRNHRIACWRSRNRLWRAKLRPATIPATHPTGSPTTRPTTRRPQPNPATVLEGKHPGGARQRGHTPPASPTHKPITHPHVSSLAPRLPTAARHHR